MTPMNPTGIEAAEQAEAFAEPILECVRRCPNFVDFPTAWAVQHDRGDKLEHHPRCSSVPGWDPISGPAFLCDCGAVEKEADRIRRSLTGVSSNG